MRRHNNIEQQTEEWFQRRKGKVTGTDLKSIMGTPKARQEAIYENIAERLTKGVETEYENPMDRGNRLEPEAIAMFEMITGKRVSKTGLCEKDENYLIANSPDGLVIDENDNGVEVKCPQGKNYVKAWLTNKIPDEYWWQVIQYFVVNEKAQKLYFVLYNPDIDIHPIHIIEVLRKDVESDIVIAEEKQKEFLEEVDKILEDIIKL